MSRMCVCLSALAHCHLPFSFGAGWKFLSIECVVELDASGTSVPSPPWYAPFLPRLERASLLFVPASTSWDAVRCTSPFEIERPSPLRSGPCAPVPLFIPVDCLLLSVVFVWKGCTLSGMSYPPCGPDMFMSSFGKLPRKYWPSASTGTSSNLSNYSLYSMAL